MTTTDTTTASPAQTDANPAAASAAAAQDSNSAPADGNGDSSSTVNPAAAQGAEPAQLLTGDNQAPADKAQDGKGDDAGTSENDGQSSDAEKPKDGEGEEGKDAQPIEYQLTAPEGMELDADALSAATPILQKHNVPQEAAQELVNIASGMLSKAAKQHADAHNAQVQKWHDATVKEFGAEGEENFKQKVGVAQKAMNKFMSKEEIKMVTHYGFGNFPALFRMAYHVGAAMQEDNTNPTGNQGESKDKTLAEIWYPNQQS